MRNTLIIKHIIGVQKFIVVTRHTGQSRSLRRLPGYEVPGLWG